LILGTKIKWFTHLNKNAPLLANEWGSFINLLDACLVNGYSEQQVTNISIVGNTLVLKYPQAHQYQQYQVVTITGANNAVLNGHHRIIDVSGDGLSMTIEYESLTGIVETSLMLTTKITPLGWEKVYNGTNKAVYKFIKDTGTPNYLFVDDSFPGAPYNTAWAKYARLGVTEDYDGDFVPKGATIPQDWSTFPSAVRGSNTYLGAYKWFYATNSESNTATNTFNTAATAGNRQWVLSGDNTYFYLANATYPNSSWYSLFGIGEYDCIFQGFKSNVFFSPFIWDNQLETNSASYMSQYTNCLVDSNKSFFILKNYIGDTVKLASLNAYPGITFSGSSTILSLGGPVNHFRTLLRSDNIIHGSLKNLYWLALLQPYAHLQKIQQGSDIFLNINQYIQTGTTGAYVIKIGSKD
jgi:hypothetical protein